jgi:twitching motility protein PilT
MPPTAHPASQPAPAQDSFDFDSILRRMLEAFDGVSDCLFVVGRPPQVEAFGKLRPIEIPQFMPTLQPLHTRMVAEKLVGDNERLKQDLRAAGSCDTSYAVPNVARFRVNVFKQNGHHAIVMRKLSTEIPTCESLKLPPICKEIPKEKNGLVFVTGATGNGKTTTLAAILNEINVHQDVHVVTLEDPIEYLHPHKRSTFSQRELGRDFPDFSTGLRAALRQAPKAILVGEVRDRETMEIALTAAETGHIVFATLHTINASQTIHRVIGMFSNEEEAQIRERLADVLRYVMSQRLVPKLGGGRVLSMEIMGSNLRVKEAVLLGEGELRDFHEIIDDNSVHGWSTFESSLLRLYKDTRITEDTAMLYSVNKPAMRKALDIAKKEIGVDDAVTAGIKLDFGALHLRPGEVSPEEVETKPKR